MTDPAVVTPPASQTPTAPADGATNQSPLDVLDQILKDAQGKAKEAVAEKVAEDEQKAAAERERQRLLDEQKLQEELVKLEEVKGSPEYKAMVDQKQEEVQEKQQYEQKMDGMQILQLQHDKA